VELVRKVGSYEDEKNRLLSNMVEGEERYQHLDNRLSKMISDYESSRGEWADQIRIKDRELSQLKEQLTYEKISINRVCDLLRVVEQDEIS
jgi:predicted RNase H-like nuclease (RuvC/YqgF family)